MKLSIALCTYDGAAYLPEQLASIVAQTRLPDELVACDDGSTDATVALLEAFAAAAPFPVRVERNPQNLGATANFERAIGLCRGDVIVLCDQDDVWHADKLARLAACFEAESVGAAFSDAELIDATGRLLGRRLWAAAVFTAPMRRRARAGGLVDVLLAHNVVTGATLAFRAALRERVLPIPPAWVHDAWIALVLAAVAGVALVDEPLVRYRVHARQAIGLARAPASRLARLAMGPRSLQALWVGAAGLLGDAGRYSAAISRACAARADQLDAARERLAADDGVRDRRRVLEQLAAKIGHLRVRANLPERRLARVPGVARELWSGRYHRHSLGLLSVARDLVLASWTGRPGERR